MARMMKKKVKMKMMEVQKIGEEEQLRIRDKVIVKLMNQE
jgi:hypothetical protein